MSERRQEASFLFLDNLETLERYDSISLRDAIRNTTIAISEGRVTRVMHNIVLGHRVGINSEDAFQYASLSNTMQVRR